MGRRQVCDEDRVLTAVRLPVSLAARLRSHAAARRISVNAVVTEAVAQFLPAEAARAAEGPTAGPEPSGREPSGREPSGREPSGRERP